MSIPKVLHVSSARLAVGGVERFLLGFCENLRQEYKFALLSGADESFQSRLGQAGCFPFAWNVKSPLDLQAAEQVGAAMALYQPAIVHLHDARAALIVRLLSRQRGAKIVYTVHLPPYSYRWKRFTALRRFIYAQVERFLNRSFTDAIVYPSISGWQEALHRQYSPSHKAFCIPNGIDLTPFASPSFERRSVNEVPIVCTVARLSEEKNVGLVLEAASLLVKQGLRFVLWIVGDGPQRKELEMKAERLGLASYTRFWGAQADVLPFLQKADIFVLASWYEGRSYSVMEAQAAGRLGCVLSNVADHAEMAAEGCGRVFPPGDVSACAEQLGWLIAHPQERGEMGRAGRAKAFREYSLQTMVGQYRNLYRSLLEEGV